MMEEKGVEEVEESGLVNKHIFWFMTGNGDTNDKSIWEDQINTRVADATEILLSLTTVKNVMVSMNKDWCPWARKVSAITLPAGTVPGRVKGRTIKWV